MSTLLKSTLACNFNCDYCHESDIRNCKSYTTDDLDINEIKTNIVRFLDKQNAQNINLHGGELTTLDIEFLEEIMEFIYHLNKKKKISVQTNGYALTDGHFNLFEKYNVNVGVSIDGPEDLNIARGRGNEQERREQHRQIMDNIKEMRRRDINVTFIAIINENHIGRADDMKCWLNKMKRMGIRSGRLNSVKGIEHQNFEIDDLIEFYLEIADYVFANSELKLKPFRNMVDNLLGFGLSSCSFTKCNPEKTPSVDVLYGDGSHGGCPHPLRGANYVPTKAEGDKDIHIRRDKILRELPMKEGGCEGCKYYWVCYGGCPANADNYYKKTNHCKLYYRLYEYIEQKIRGLFPNIQLVIDAPDEQYSTRKSNQKGDAPFRKMLPQHLKNKPSTFKNTISKGDNNPGKGWSKCGDS